MREGTGGAPARPPSPFLGPSSDEGQPRPPRRRPSLGCPSGPGPASESRPQVLHAEPLSAPTGPRHAPREVHPHSREPRTSEASEGPSLSARPKGAARGRAPEASPPGAARPTRPPSPGRSPALLGRSLPNTSLATSEGNSMIRAARGAARRDEPQLKADAATAPAPPHLPVPLAVLNPRQFVPPLSFHISQSLPRDTERRRNETRLRAPRACRHFRLRRAGAGEDPLAGGGSVHPWAE